MATFASPVSTATSAAPQPTAPADAVPAGLLTKTAPTAHPVHELIRQRWSPRAFTSQPVSADALATVFEAASWAASASNGQPWIFVFAHRADTADFERLLHSLVPPNQAWAKDAAVLVLALARTTNANGQPNKWAHHDVGAATTTLLLQATAQGLHGHVMAGFEAEKTRDVFALPAHIEPVTFIALGYQGAPELLAEPFLTRELAPRTRKPVSEIAFAGKPVF